MTDRPASFQNKVIKSPWLWLAILVVAMLVIASFAPLERTLGANARLVYLHGAWVWTGMLVFAAAGLVGLLGLALRNLHLHHWSHALGRVGLCFWITFLAMSLYLLQANWNGLFFDEPRFRIPFNLAVTALLLQAGLSFLPAGAISSLGNLAFAGLMLWSMRGIDTVLHPDSPIFNSDARDIRIFFIALLVLLLLSAWQLGRGWMLAERHD